MNKQELNILQDAAAEIERLRKANELQAVRLEMFDKMMLLFTSSPAWPGQEVMRPDPLHQLVKLIDKTKQEQNAVQPEAKESNF